MASSNWRPTADPAGLQERAELTWRIRAFFQVHGFLEVHTPTLSHDTVIDRYIEPLAIEAEALGVPGLASSPLYLQTSPEFCMKRLMAAGMRAIYQIAPAFRSGERGAHHNPEFTMLEWYRAGDDLRAAVKFLSDLIEHVLARGRPRVQTYREVFLQFAAIDPLAADIAALAACARQLHLNIDVDFSSDRDDWLNLIFAESIQPQLGRGQPSVVTHYPASQSALACLSPDDPRTAERFELFIDGIELANGYHELLDASELERRNVRVSAQRQADGHRGLPLDSRLLDAMRTGMPACSGCALGLDRLVMVAQHRTRIEDVIAFPIERA